jgi:hypothetical protein
MRSVFVADYPAVQHRHANGDIVTVRLRRTEGEYRVLCAECDTEFVYRKPAASAIRHYKSPLLPPVKGNFDSEDH